MISVITTIYNQLGANKLFYESLKKYSRNKFELIVIDNDSSDGSREFFENENAVVIRNNGNFSYGYCQNKGIEAAKFDYLCFLNNDMVVSPGWDEKAKNIMEKNNFEVISCCSLDRLENEKNTHKIRRRWKRIKYPLLYIFGNSYRNLNFMVKLMYGNWENWTAKRYKEFGEGTIENIAGCNVIMKRSALDKIGLWDERIVEADADIFLRTKKRAIEKGDISPVQLLTGVYLHHHTRLTIKSKCPPYVDIDHLIPIRQKWDSIEANRMFEGTGMGI